MVALAVNVAPFAFDHTNTTTPPQSTPNRRRRSTFDAPREACVEPGLQTELEAKIHSVRAAMAEWQQGILKGRHDATSLLATRAALYEENAGHTPNAIQLCLERLAGELKAVRDSLQKPDISGTSTLTSLLVETEADFSGPFTQAATELKDNLAAAEEWLATTQWMQTWQRCFTEGNTPSLSLIDALPDQQILAILERTAEHLHRLQDITDRTHSAFRSIFQPHVSALQTEFEGPFQAAAMNMGKVVARASIVQHCAQIREQMAYWKESFAYWSDPAYFVASQVEDAQIPQTMEVIEARLQDLKSFIERENAALQPENEALLAELQADFDNLKRMAERLLTILPIFKAYAVLHQRIKHWTHLVSKRDNDTFTGGLVYAGIGHIRLEVLEELAQELRDLESQIAVADETFQPMLGISLAELRAVCGNSFRAAFIEMRHRAEATMAHTLCEQLLSIKDHDTAVHAIFENFLIIRDRVRSGDLVLSEPMALLLEKLRVRVIEKLEGLPIKASLLAHLPHFCTYSSIVALQMGLAHPLPAKYMPTAAEVALMDTLLNALSQQHKQDIRIFILLYLGQNNGSIHLLPAMQEEFDKLKAHVFSIFSQIAAQAISEKPFTPPPPFSYVSFPETTRTSYLKTSMNGAIPSSLFELAIQPELVEKQSMRTEKRTVELLADLPPEIRDVIQAEVEAARSRAPLEGKEYLQFLQETLTDILARPEFAHCRPEPLSLAGENSLALEQFRARLLTIFSSKYKSDPAYGPYCNLDCEVSIAEQAN